MIVERISEPEDPKTKSLLRKACVELEAMDYPLIASVDVAGEVLCIVLRKVGAEHSSHIAVPLTMEVPLEAHVRVAMKRIPDAPKPWPEGFAEMADKPLTPKVGVGVMVLRGMKKKIENREVLLGMRKGSHGAGEWSLPGGHLELGETPKACARRELMEETGIAVKEFNEYGWSNDVMADEGLHYVTLFLGCNVAEDVEPRLLEPDKTAEWRWFKLHLLPNPIFAPSAKMLRAWKLPDRMFS